MASPVDWTGKMDHAFIMLGHALISLHRMVLLAVIAVALIATGFAHRVAAPQDEALAFALANGGSLADICGDQPGGRSDGGALCLACQIAGTADLPPVQGALVDVELAFVAKVIAPRHAMALPRVLDLANSPQGPPVA
ncbi:MAG: hypothetical protein NTW20_12785 [Rhodobacterales bacterium]|nr:hypothetical protein [Rhodobacterales bacterium]